MEFRKFKDIASPEEAEEFGTYWMDKVRLRDEQEFRKSLSEWNRTVLEWILKSPADIPFGEVYLRHATKLGRYLSETK